MLTTHTHTLCASALCYTHMDHTIVWLRLRIGLSWRPQLVVAKWSSDSEANNNSNNS